jgi:ATP-dependent DNA ligase
VQLYAFDILALDGEDLRACRYRCASKTSPGCWRADRTASSSHRAGAPAKAVRASKFGSVGPIFGQTMSSFEFCLPTKSASVPVGPEWLREIKYDRLRLERDGDRVRLITREEGFL